jgi:hypothetical protein
MGWEKAPITIRSEKGRLFSPSSPVALYSFHCIFIPHQTIYSVHHND